MFQFSPYLGKNKFNIYDEFKNLIDELSYLHPKNRLVENLFLVTWPSISRDSISNTWQKQIEILVKHLDKINWDPTKKIYFKKHQKL